MLSDIDLQRRRDGAFFEDWSQWRDLGGWAQWVQCHPSVGKRRTNMPAFFLRLEKRALLIDGPGFEIGVPQRAAIETALRRLRGIKWPSRIHAQRGIYMWSVPAEEWPALQEALPSIRQSIAEMMRR